MSSIFDYASLFHFIKYLFYTDIVHWFIFFFTKCNLMQHLQHPKITIISLNKEKSLPFYSDKKKNIKI